MSHNTRNLEAMVWAIGILLTALILLLSFGCASSRFEDKCKCKAECECGEEGVEFIPRKPGVPIY